MAHTTLLEISSTGSKLVYCLVFLLSLHTNYSKNLYACLSNCIESPSVARKIIRVLKAVYCGIKCMTIANIGKYRNLTKTIIQVHLISLRLYDGCSKNLDIGLIFLLIRGVFRKF